VLRLIYHLPEIGYKMENSANQTEVLALEENLKEKEVEVICIVDLKTNYIFNKSSDFLEHMDRVNDRFFDWDFCAS
jgi:hypothetical protein